MKKSLFTIILLSVFSFSYSQTSQMNYGLDILNLVRENYSLSKLTYSKSLSEYALKKAAQYVNEDSDEVLVSMDNVGLQYIIFEGNVAKEVIENDKRFAAVVLSFIDIDCDKEDKYDLFNQVVDSDSKEIGIAEYYDTKNQRMSIVLVYDNYVYNQETDSDK